MGFKSDGELYAFAKKAASIINQSGNAQDREDLAQEIAVRVWQSKRGQSLSYYWAVARYAAKDYFRRKTTWDIGRGRTRDGKQFYKKTPVNSLDELQEAFGYERHHNDLYAADHLPLLRYLPERQRLAVFYYIYLDYRVVDIAEILNITPSGADRLLARALPNFYRLIKEGDTGTNANGSWLNNGTDSQVAALIDRDR